MSLSAKNIKYNKLYFFFNKGKPWFLTKRYAKQILNSDVVAYTVCGGKVETAVGGKIEKDDSEDDKITIVSSGENKGTTLLMGSLSPAKFIVYDNGNVYWYNGRTEVYEENAGLTEKSIKNIEYFNHRVIFESREATEKSIAFLHVSDRILGVKVFNKEYPIFASYKIDSNDRILECTVGVVMKVDEEKEEHSAPSLTVKNGEVHVSSIERDLKYQKLLIKGWKINTSSKDNDFISLGNPLTAQNYEVALIDCGSVDGLTNIYHVTRDIISFNNDPMGYFKNSPKSARKHKSIFDKDGK